MPRGIYIRTKPPWNRGVPMIDGQKRILSMLRRQRIAEGTLEGHRIPHSGDTKHRLALIAFLKRGKGVLNPHLPEPASEPTENAYFAGFFDGEGSVGIYRHPRGRGYSYKCTLTNTDPRPLIRARQIWGGHLRCTVRAGQGQRQKDIWRLEWNANRAVAFLEAIQPYLCIKNDQVDVFLSVARFIFRGGRARSADTVASVNIAMNQLAAFKH